MSVSCSSCEIALRTFGISVDFVELRMERTIWSVTACEILINRAVHWNMDDVYLCGFNVGAIRSL